MENAYMTPEEKYMMEKLSDRASFAFVRANGLEEDSNSSKDDIEVKEAYQEYEFLNLIINKLNDYFDLRKSVQIIINATEDIHLNS